MWKSCDISNATLTHWLPPSFLNLNLDDRTRSQEIAYLIHTFLFEGRYFISDSNFLNNANLRQAINESDTIRYLVEQKYLQIAVRESNGTRMSLRDTISALVKSGGKIGVIPEDIFLSTNEIDFLESKGEFIPFPLENAAQYYTDRLLLILDQPIESEIFRGFEGAGFLIDDMKIYAQECLARDGKLGTAHFNREDTFGKWLENRYPTKNYWSHFNDAIRQVGRSPHHSYLTDALDSNPHYFPEHSTDVNLWRTISYGLNSPKMEATVKEYRLKVNEPLLSRPNAILALDPDDLDYLIKSSEAIAYFSALNGLISRDSDFGELQDRYCDYRRRIESRVAAKLGVITSPGGEEFLSIRVIEYLNKSLQKVGLFAVLSVAEDPWDKILPAVQVGLDVAIPLIAAKPGKKEQGKLANMHDKELDRVIEALDVSEDTNANLGMVESEIHVDGWGKRDTKMLVTGSY